MPRLKWDDALYLADQWAWVEAYRAHGDITDEMLEEWHARWNELHRDLVGAENDEEYRRMSEHHAGDEL